MERVPATEIRTAKEEAAWEYAKRKMVETSAPRWLPKVLARLFVGLFFNEDVVTKQLKSSSAAVAKMHAFGIPIVIGSDSGCWPALPSMFHGISSVREVELLVQAGLSPLAAIQAATQNAALMIGISKGRWNY